MGPHLCKEAKKYSLMYTKDEKKMSWQSHLGHWGMAEICTGRSVYNMIVVQRDIISYILIYHCIYIYIKTKMTNRIGWSEFREGT